MPQDLEGSALGAFVVCVGGGGGGSFRVCTLAFVLTFFLWRVRVGWNPYREEAEIPPLRCREGVLGRTPEVEQAAVCRPA